MALKFAVEAEAPGARVWLDQDQRDKSEQGAPCGALGAHAISLGSHTIPMSVRLVQDNRARHE